MADVAKEKKYLYWLCSQENLGAVSIGRIWDQIKSFEDAYYIEGTELLRRGIFRTARQARAYDQAKGLLEERLEEYEGLSSRKIRFVTFLDQEYPKRLRHMYDYPKGLWVKGELPSDSRPTAAVIGARACSSYGEQAAFYMGRELARSGVQVIGGLALGIDKAGHRGALDGQGQTFGVLGCGVNICYPQDNFRLFAQMEHQGGILSEYGLGIPARAGHFPVRNRIISGLSDAVLVMEAREKSGSLITANLGLDQGKEVFALPGRITDAASKGCNQLIKEGAQVLTGVSDVLDYLGIIHRKNMNFCENNAKGLAKIEKMVYSFLDSEPRHIEAIACASGLDVTECIALLTELELKGMAVKITGQYYARRPEF